VISQSLFGLMAKENDYGEFIPGGWSPAPLQGSATEDQTTAPAGTPTKAKIIRIVENGSSVRQMAKYQKMQTIYTLGSNSVIVEDGGKLITAFSNGPGGIYIP
jgi:hypothetical protein